MLYQKQHDIIKAKVEFGYTTILYNNLLTIENNPIQVYTLINNLNLKKLKKIQNFHNFS